MNKIKTEWKNELPRPGTAALKPYQIFAVMKKRIYLLYGRYLQV